jgi:hypothetical protein
MEIKFYLTEAKVKSVKTKDWRVLERMQAGAAPNIDALANIAARFMVDDQNEPLTPEDANAILDELELGEWTKVSTNLFTALSAFAVPKENGKPSSLPPTPPAAEESPAG